MIQRSSVRVSTLAVLCALLLAFAASFAVAATIRGTSGPDNLTGTPTADNINAGGGADTVRAFKGNDTVRGGPGNDELYGGPNKDRVFGAPGDDLVVGGTGPDTVSGGIGRDTLEGRGGDDTINAAGDGQRDEVSCGTGDDTAIVDLNDVVDGQLVSSVLGVGNLVGAIGSCERVELRILQ